MKIFIFWRKLHFFPAISWFNDCLKKPLTKLHCFACGISGSLCSGAKANNAFSFFFPLFLLFCLFAFASFFFYSFITAVCVVWNNKRQAISQLRTIDWTPRYVGIPVVCVIILSEFYGDIGCKLYFRYG